MFARNEKEKLSSFACVLVVTGKKNPIDFIARRIERDQRPLNLLREAFRIKTNSSNRMKMANEICRALNWDNNPH